MTTDPIVEDVCSARRQVEQEAANAVNRTVIQSSNTCYRQTSQMI